MDEKKAKAIENIVRTAIQRAHADADSKINEAILSLIGERPDDVESIVFLTSRMLRYEISAVAEIWKAAKPFIGSREPEMMARIIADIFGIPLVKTEPKRPGDPPQRPYGPLLSDPAYG